MRLPLFKYTGAAGEKMVRVSEDGQSAHTVFKVLNRFSDGLLHRVGLSNLTLVEATLKTGRTHQIRVHMQSQAVRLRATNATATIRPTAACKSWA